MWRWGAGRGTAEDVQVWRGVLPCVGPGLIPVEGWQRRGRLQRHPGVLAAVYCAGSSSRMYRTLLSFGNPACANATVLLKFWLGRCTLLLLWYLPKSSGMFYSDMFVWCGGSICWECKSLRRYTPYACAPSRASPAIQFAPRHKCP